MLPTTPANPSAAFVTDVGAATFQQDVLEKSLSTPVLLDFWAEWCGPCKQLGPTLEKLAAEYNGAFVLAKIDVEAEQELAGQFAIRSIPTVILVKDGQLVDGFPGVLAEGQIREFLQQHGIVPAQPAEPENVAPETLAEAITRLRAEIAATPENDSLKLDLALALAHQGETVEAKTLIDALPANLGADDRAVNAGVLIANVALLEGAPDRGELERRIASDLSDLSARHLLGLRLLGDGETEEALLQFLEMLKQNRDFEDGLPRKALIEAFDVISDAELVSRYRRKMASLLF